MAGIEEQIIENNSWYATEHNEADLIAPSVIYSSFTRESVGFIRVKNFLPLKEDALEFENEHYPSFANTDSYLLFQYKDYWSFPLRIDVAHSASQKKLDDKDLAIAKKYLYIE